jgi:hypothetical protein
MAAAVRQPGLEAPRLCSAADYLIVDVNTVRLTELVDLIGKKEIRTAVGSVLPLVEVRAAHQMLAGTLAHKPGKIVLQVA